MMVASFQQWKEQKLSFAQNSKKKSEQQVKCYACKGSGEIECDCSCDYCDRHFDCDECDGTGKVNAKEIDLHQFRPSRQDYFNEVIADIKAFCVWTQKDFLAEVGDFVRGYQKGNY